MISTHHQSLMLKFEDILDLVNMIFLGIFGPNLCVAGGSLGPPQLTSRYFEKNLARVTEIFLCRYKFRPPLLWDKPVAGNTSAPATASFHHAGKFGRVYEWRVCISARHYCVYSSGGYGLLPATTTFLK
jgi:hypothetical protein